jgi:hypothetical protein
MSLKQLQSLPGIHGNVHFQEGFPTEVAGDYQMEESGH